jgi:hypothetical protein
MYDHSKKACPAVDRQGGKEITIAEVSGAFQVIQRDASSNGQLEEVLTVGRRRTLQGALHLLHRVDIPASQHVWNDISLCCWQLFALSRGCLRKSNVETQKNGNNAQATAQHDCCLGHHGLTVSKY